MLVNCKDHSLEYFQCFLSLGGQLTVLQNFKKKCVAYVLFNSAKFIWACVNCEALTEDGFTLIDVRL